MPESCFGVHLPTYLRTDLASYLSIYLSVCLSIYLSIYHTHMYIYIYTYIYTYIHTYIQTYIQTDIHTDIHTYIQTYIQTDIHTDIHTYIQTYIQTYIHTNIQTYRQTYIHTNIQTYIRIYIYTYIQHTNIHTYAYVPWLTILSLWWMKTYVKPQGTSQDPQDLWPPRKGHKVVGECIGHHLGSADASELEGPRFSKFLHKSWMVMVNQCKAWNWMATASSSQTVKLPESIRECVRWPSTIRIKINTLLHWQVTLNCPSHCAR